MESKVFFYGNIDVDDNTHGITKKVFAEIKTLRKMGYQVYYTGYHKDGVAIFDDNEEIVMKSNYSTSNSSLNRYLRRWDLLKISKQFIANSDVHFKYSYLRFHFFDKSYTELLKNLKRKGTFNIIEAHMYPYRHKGIRIMSAMYILDAFYESIAKKYIDLVAAISDYDNIWGCKTVKIDNGILLEDISVREYVKASDGLIRLLCVSNERKYHAYPKLIKGLSKYYLNGGSANIKITMVGEYYKTTRSLVDNLGLKDKIEFVGKKNGEELDNLYNNADIGVGAFGLRAGEKSGSSIKTKEYFAKGLPFINGWKEYAFDDTYKYVKRFEPTSDFIDFNEVINFYETISDDTEVSTRMRCFAKDNYTWEKQLEKVFNINKGIDS